MSRYKFLPYTLKDSPFYDPIYIKPWFVKFHSYLWNPFGNKHEPCPFPDKHARKYKRLKHIRWFLRNPFHNPTHFLFGITPSGEYLEWISLEEDGWELIDGYYVRGKQRRKKYTGKGYGVQSRGNFRLSTGNKVVDGLILIATITFICAAVVMV